jgi:hypothetical protein
VPPVEPEGADRPEREVVAAVVFAVNVLAGHVGLTVAHQAAVLQAALSGVVMGLVAWHCWQITR